MLLAEPLGVDARFSPRSPLRPRGIIPGRTGPAQWSRPRKPIPLGPGFGFFRAGPARGRHESVRPGPSAGRLRPGPERGRSGRPRPSEAEAADDSATSPATGDSIGPDPRCRVGLVRNHVRILIARVISLIFAKPTQKNEENPPSFAPTLRIRHNRVSDRNHKAIWWTSPGAAKPGQQPPRGDNPMTVQTTQPDRAEISRRNGSKSRGPQSAEGKTRSRMNALKHGMTARIPVLPGEDEAAFRRQVNGFTRRPGPRNAVELALAEQAALASGRSSGPSGPRPRAWPPPSAPPRPAPTSGSEDEVAAMGHWLLTDTLRARQDAAASLLPFLSADRHDPFRRGRGEPRHIVLRLEATAGGCRWLLGPVGPAPRAARAGPRLADQRADRGPPTARAAAVGPGCRSMGVPARADAGGGPPELVAEARRRLLSQLGESLPGDPAGRRAALLRLVQEEAARLSSGRPGTSGARRPTGPSWPTGWRWIRRRKGSGCGGTSSISTASCTGTQQPAEAPAGRGCRRSGDPTAPLSPSPSRWERSSSRAVR